MKVLHVIDSLGRGGAEQLLVTLLPELRRQGVSVALAVRGGSMDLMPLLKTQGIEPLILKPRHRWNLIGFAAELVAIARHENAQVIHAHLYFPAVATALIKVAHLGALPTCVTFHNLAYGGANQKGMKLAFRRKLAKFLYPRGIDAFFGVSEAVARHYESHMSLPHIRVIPNPVDLSKVQEAATKISGVNGRLVLPGRIVKEKGHAIFFEALVKLKAKGLVPKVAIAGDGPLRSRVEAQARELGLTDQVEFLGSLSHDDMLQVMAGASLVVVPSLFEGFGITALEGMALGRAVVASDAGGLPELVGDAGVIVPAGDATALSGAIADLLSNPTLRDELVAKATARSQMFDLPSIAELQIAAYHDLMQSHEAQA